MDRRRLAAIDRLVRSLGATVPPDSACRAASPGALLSLAYPDRIAQRRIEGNGRYLLASGLGAELPRDDALAVHPYLVIPELDPRPGDGRVQLALPVTESELRLVHSARLVTQAHLSWDADREAAVAREETLLGALALSSRVVPVADQDEALTLLLDQIARRFDRALPWTPAARQLQARVALLRRLDPDAGWPDWSDTALIAALPVWLGPWLVGKQRLADVQRLDLTKVLLGSLNWDHRQRLDAEAPTHLVTPAGTRRPLDYGSGTEPSLAVPLQEMFGASATPTVAAGRVPVLLQLLSPARRPVQVTRDLASFWAQGYIQVRKELRGRYPKHHWPDDPASAAPVAGGVKRRSTA